MWEPSLIDDLQHHQEASFRPWLCEKRSCTRPRPDTRTLNHGCSAPIAAMPQKLGLSFSFRSRRPACTQNHASPVGGIVKRLVSSHIKSTHTRPRHNALIASTDHNQFQGCAQPGGTKCRSTFSKIKAARTTSLTQRMSPAETSHDRMRAGTGVL